MRISKFLQDGVLYVFESCSAIALMLVLIFIVLLLVLC